MASLPYPLNRLYTHIVSVIATTQSAVHSYCQCDCHHSIGLYTHVCVGMAGMPYPPTDTHSSVFKKPVLLFFCLSPTTCSHVLLSFQTTTCSHVLMSFPNNMFSCSSVFSNNNMFSCSSVFSKTTCSSVFPPKEPCSPSNPVFMSPKKTAESNAPSR